MPQLLVVGGQRLAADDVFSATMMTWDGSAWHTFVGPEPFSGSVNSLLVWNGQLVASGTSGTLSNPVMAWNGTAWLPLGAPLPDYPAKLVDWNGTLVAVSDAPIAPATVRLWNGTTWTALPTLPTLHRAFSIVSYQGLLCVGGANSAVNQGVIERWNGTSWLPSIVTEVSTFNRIEELAVRGSLLIGGTATLYAAGQFATIGGTAAANIAATSGGSAFAWSPLGAGLAGACTALAVRNTGLTSEVVVSIFQGFGTSPVLRYGVPLTGGSPAWSQMGMAYLDSIRFFSGQYFGTQADRDPAALLRYDGTAWRGVAAAGFDGEVNAATRFGDDTIVGGTFTTDGTTSLARIARWDGTSLQPVGTGIQGTSVDALLTLSNGDVIAGGLFPSAGGIAAANIARWNGTAWSPLGLGLDGQVLALAQASNGDLLAGGKFTFSGAIPCSRIARWDGSTWSALGLGMTGDVNALLPRANGVVIAGGSFGLAGGVLANNIAQWNGTNWSSLGSGTNGPVLGLAQRPTGEVLAVGSFTTAGGVLVYQCARWFGTWTSVGASFGGNLVPRALVTLPNGDILAGRGFHQATSITPDEGISRWNGTTWSGLGAELAAGHPVIPIRMRAMALRADGAVVLGGNFQSAGQSIAFHLTHLSPTCSATATAYGTGCSTAAGPLVLTADSLPWIGSTFRTTTTGIGPVSLCLGLTGFSQQAIPMGAVLPQGQPGCTLLSGFDVIDLLPIDANGTATSSLVLANSSSLIGAQFYQQAVPLEFNAQFALTAVRSSNALALVIGSL